MVQILFVICLSIVSPLAIDKSFTCYDRNYHVDNMYTNVSHTDTKIMNNKYWNEENLFK